MKSSQAEIQNLMLQWLQVPILDPAERGVIEALSSAINQGMDEFIIARDALGNAMAPVLWMAIQKGRLFNVGKS